MVLEYVELVGDVSKLFLKSFQVQARASKSNGICLRLTSVILPNIFLTTS